MDAKLKAKWVKALRSGKYEQGSFGLKRDSRYCCLGVLVEVCKGNTPVDVNSWLSGNDLRKFGLTDRQQVLLGSMNDTGVPFDMIAGLIDEAL